MLCIFRPISYRWHYCQLQYSAWQLGNTCKKEVLLFCILFDTEWFSANERYYLPVHPLYGPRSASEPSMRLVLTMWYPGISVQLCSAIQLILHLSQCNICLFPIPETFSQSDFLIVAPHFGQRLLRLNPLLVTLPPDTSSISVSFILSSILLFSLSVSPFP